MDDLYAEVMALLHDTGAFAKRQENQGLARVVAESETAVRRDMPDLRLAHVSDVIKGGSPSRH